MKAAVVDEFGKDPTLRDYEDPVPLDDEVRVTVTAAALTHFTKARAAGKYPGSDTRPPLVPGIDGVGRLDDGSRVYFVFPRAPYGGIAEETVVSPSRCIAVPDDLDDITVAALADPGMSAWTALEARARMSPGSTVLVNGATGTAGSVAVQIAKHLGARTVIGTGRNQQALEALHSHGADEVIDLTGESGKLRTALRERFERGVDVVLDYLWGPSAEQILAAAANARRDAPMCFIQIGTTSAPTITLPGTLLRSSAIEVKGSGLGSVSLEEITGILARLIKAAASAGLRVPTRPVPLERVEETWSTAAGTPRVVFTMNS